MWTITLQENISHRVGTGNTKNDYYFTKKEKHLTTRTLSSSRIIINLTVNLNTDEHWSFWKWSTHFLKASWVTDIHFKMSSEQIFRSISCSHEKSFFILLNAILTHLQEYPQYQIRLKWHVHNGIFSKSLHRYLKFWVYANSNKEKLETFQILSVF